MSIIIYYTAKCPLLISNKRADKLTLTAMSIFPFEHIIESILHTTESKQAAGDAMQRRAEFTERFGACCVITVPPAATHVT